MKLTPKAITALRLLEGTNYRNTRSAKALASMLWPEKLKSCGTSLRRGGLYRAAGGYYAKLQREGLVAHWMDDYDRGYFLTEKGKLVLDANAIELTGALKARPNDRRE